MDSYKLSRMIKAKSAGQLPIYDADGNLIGLVDPADVMAVADSPGNAAPSKAAAATAAPAAPAAVGQPAATAEDAPLVKAQMSLAGALAPMSNMQARDYTNAVTRGAFAFSQGLGIPGKQASALAHTLGADVLKKSQGRATPDDLGIQVQALIKALQ